MSDYLENIRLILIRDESEPPMWLDRWAVSYPMVHTIDVSGSQTITHWQTQLSGSLKTLSHDEQWVLVAHGAGANALVAWYCTTNTAMQKRVVVIILVAPIQALCQDDAMHTFQRVRFNCPTALVTSKDDDLSPSNWARQMAANWQARHLITPHCGHLNTKLDGWQWGMKLMQEMLLSL